MAVHSRGVGCFFCLKETRKNKPTVLILHEQHKKNLHFQIKVIGDMGVIIMEGTLEACTMAENVFHADGKSPETFLFV